MFAEKVGIIMAEISSPPWYLESDGDLFVWQTPALQFSENGAVNAYEASGFRDSQRDRPYRIYTLDPSVLRHKDLHYTVFALEDTRYTVKNADAPAHYVALEYLGQWLRFNAYCPYLPVFAVCVLESKVRKFSRTCRPSEDQQWLLGDVNVLKIKDCVFFNEESLAMLPAILIPCDCPFSGLECHAHHEQKRKGRDDTLWELLRRADLALINCVVAGRHPHLTYDPNWEPKSFNLLSHYRAWLQHKVRNLF